MLLGAFMRGEADYSWMDVHVLAGGRHAVFQMFADAARVDGVRQVCCARDAQLIADHIGALMPTPKLLDERWDQSDVRIDPQPKYYRGGVGMDSNAAIAAHSARVDAAIGARSGPVADVGKHWVLYNRATSQLAVLYGWHVLEPAPSWRGIKLYPAASDNSERVIQAPSTAHGLTHSDYSMTLVLLRGQCMIDGEPMVTADVLTSPELCGLAVASGRPLLSSRQPGVQLSPKA